MGIFQYGSDRRRKLVKKPRPPQPKPEAKPK